MIFAEDRDYWSVNITHGHNGYAQLRKGRASIANQIYHVTSSTTDREPVFVDFYLGREVVNALRREHDAGHLESLAFVVMPDHFHWLFSLGESRSLSLAVNTAKSFATRRINALRGTNGRLWSPGFYDRAIRRDEDLVTVARYIVANPLRAGLVTSIRGYPLWDAKWL